MGNNHAKELFLEKMRQFPVDQWRQSGDVVRFLRERAQRKTLGDGASPSDYVVSDRRGQSSR